MLYHFKSLVLVRKGRAFYSTLYQDVFFGKTGGGGSLKVCIKFHREPGEFVKYCIRRVISRNAWLLANFLLLIYFGCELKSNKYLFFGHT